MFDILETTKFKFITRNGHITIQKIKKIRPKQFSL